MTRGFLLHVIIIFALVSSLIVPTPAYAATFVVTIPVDLPDPFVGDGICGILRLEIPPFTSYGPCSLRAALQEASALPGSHEIRFAIGSGVQSIPITAELPAITHRVTIDGWSQGGSGYTGPPLIELNGAGAGSGARGLHLITDNNTVRGLAINRFDGPGIEITGTHNTIVGTYIGTDPNGTIARSNRTGILIHGASNQIGGLNAYERNLISGNTESGIRLNTLASENQIVGNYIGTNAAGTAGLGNGVGVLVWGYRNIVGGLTSTLENVIAFNSGAGIEVALASSGTWYNAILHNSIHSNGGLGIDLVATIGGRADGATPNDDKDWDVGANFLQNYPVLTSATPGPSSTVTGSLNSEPNALYWVELFVSPSCDPSGYGEGRTFLTRKDVTTNASGNVSFSVAVPALTAGQVVTATATKLASLDTSEFSPCVTVVLPTSLCAPRPNVKVQTEAIGQGQLRATLTAQTLPATPTNGLQQLTFSNLNNAQVLLNGAPVGVGASVPLAGAQTVQFIVKRSAPGATTVHFVVKDACGDWKSFVGGGPNAF